MNYEVIHDGKDRESWLAARKQGIGGSDAPVVLGISPWRSPLDLYAEKISDTTDDGGSEATHWGHLLEPLILNRFKEMTARRVERDGRLLRSGEREWQLATLDGLQALVDDSKPPLLTHQGLVEIKATSLKDNWENGPPPYVIAQVQHQLAVTGFSFGSVAVLFNGKEFAWYDVARDDEYIAKLIEKEEAFWWRVVTRDPPPAESGDRDAIAKLFPTATDVQPIPLLSVYEDVDEELQRLKAKLSWDKDRIAELENKIKLAIGNHVSGQLPSGVTYTLKDTHRDAYTVPASDFRTLRRVKGK